MATPGRCNSLKSTEDEEDESGLEEQEREESCKGDEDYLRSSEVNVSSGLTQNGRETISYELEDFRRRWKCEIHNQNLFNKNNLFTTREDWLTLDQGSTLKSHEGCNTTSVDHGRVVGADKMNVTQSNLKDKVRCDNGDQSMTHNDGGDKVSVTPNQSEAEMGENDDEDDYDDEEDVNKKIIKNATDTTICKTSFHQQATHISDLPLEVLDLIFKWVVSSYLDVRSLEMLSMVCKSFYLLARDEDIWRTICMRTWEKACLSPSYTSHRQMFVERPHVMFNGCYISKATYFRQGEKSFDGFYKPFHLVKYYRYIRFYPEGKVYMFMSPEQPKKAVVHLKYKSNYVQGLQYGYYKLSDDKVSLVMKKIPEPSMKIKRFQKNTGCYGDHEQTFFLEMSLKTIKRRKNVQLTWLKYFMHRVNKSSGESTTMTFDISDTMYPPFYFCPVRSFAAQSELPL